MAAFTGWQIASYRAAIAAAFLLIALPDARRNWTWHTFAGGAVYALTIVFYVLANKLTTAANAILLQSTSPIYLLVLGPAILKEKLRAVDLAVVGGVILGAVILFSGSENVVATAPDPFHGNLVALGSGVGWALTITALRWMGKRNPQSDSAASVVIAGSLIAAVACFPLALQGSPASIGAVAVVFYLGLFQVGLAYLCLTRSIRHLPAIDVATLLLIEPVLNPIWAWMIHGERPSGRALIGGAIIMTAAFLGSWWQAREEAMQSASSSLQQS